MNSIITKGIFSSYGFSFVIFIVLGIYLLSRSLKLNRNSCIDKKKVIVGIISLIVGIVFFVLYIVQLKNIL